MATPMDHGYIQVADRHLKFTEDHPDGSIASEVQHFVFDPVEGKGFVVVNAKVWKDGAKRMNGAPADGEGNASMPIPGPTSFTKNSEVENAETSALGRALAMIGYHPKESMASGEEVAAKGGKDKTRVSKTSGEELASQAQLGKMFAMAKEAGIDLKTDDGKTALQAIVLAATGKRSSKQLLSSEMDIIYSTLETKAEEAA